MASPSDLVRPPVPDPRGGVDGRDDAGVTTLIDALLAEQRRLTAVERFSQRHAASTGPALESHYRDLIPLSAPRPGEQYAFAVDLDRCSGCKGCVTACHSLNGLDEEEAWRSVGFLVGEKLLPARSGPVAEVPSPDLGTDNQRPPPSPASRFGIGNRVIPLQQTVTTACHHCADPACLNGCPVLAYDKDPLTGIVRHLDDQCIGCSYCILMCPYEVPQYSASRGIVRKCDLCHGRLAEGEAPACVQACPNEAIQITLVRPTDLVQRYRKTAAAEDGDSTAWLPDAPSPALSVPTTQYRTRHPEVSLRAADQGQPTPAAPHFPLVLMLVLTQAGLGGLMAILLEAVRGSAPGGNPLRSSLGLAILSFALLNVGLAASVFHLGQPRKAWRVWMGWRTSWLSREAIALNAAAGVAALVLAVLGLQISAPWAPPGMTDIVGTLRSWQALLPGLLLPAMLLGSTLMALVAQTMVYAKTGRAFWSLRWTAPRFAGTAVLSGLVVAWALRPGWDTGALLGFATALKLAAEIAVLKHGDSDADLWTQLRRTAVLQRGPLRPLLCFRLLLGVIGGLLLPYGVGAGAIPAGYAVAAFPILLSGEIAERLLYFTSVSPDKMPGLPG